jgi:hypothetical protein
MAFVLSSSGLAPLSSVVICWNIIGITLNMSFRDELFALEAWTEWLGTCWLCLKERGGGAHISPILTGKACATVDSWGCCRYHVLLRSPAVEDSPGVSELLYDLQFTANQFVLVPNPLRPMAGIFF